MSTVRSVDWSGLFPVLVADIAGRLQTVEDFTAMRGVCRPWRAAVAITDHGAKSETVPLLMFAPIDNSEERMLYSISQRRIISRTVFNEADSKRCVGARFGWFVTLGDRGEVNLLNPISRAHIELPHVWTFPRARGLFMVPSDLWITRAILTDDPSDGNDSYVLIVVAAHGLGFWTPGTSRWRWVEASRRSSSPSFDNLGFCKGEFFAVDYHGKIWALDPARFHDDTDATSARVVVTVPGQLIGSYKAMYLVESSAGDLILVMRDGTMNDLVYRQVDGDIGVAQDLFQNDLNFDLIKIDVVNGRWEMMNSLGNDAFFLASNHPFCIQLSSSGGGGGVRPNRIYFADDCAVTPPGFGFGRRVGVYHVQYGACELFFHDEPVGPPLFVESSIVLRS